MDEAEHCFVCAAPVEPLEVEEPSTLPFGAKPNLSLYDRAIRELEAALDRDPRDPRLLNQLGAIFQKKNELTRALECYVRVAEIHEADGFVLKAVAVYKQVLKLRPDHLHVRLHLANLLEELGLTADAVAQLEAALHTQGDPALLEKVRAELERLRRR